MKNGLLLYGSRHELPAINLCRGSAKANTFQCNQHLHFYVAHWFYLLKAIAWLCPRRWWRHSWEMSSVESSQELNVTQILIQPILLIYRNMRSHFSAADLSAKNFFSAAFTFCFLSQLSRNWLPGWTGTCAWIRSFDKKKKKHFADHSSVSSLSESWRPQANSYK